MPPGQILLSEQPIRGQHSIARPTFSGTRSEENSRRDRRAAEGGGRQAHSLPPQHGQTLRKYPPRHPLRHRISGEKTIRPRSWPGL